MPPTQYLGLQIEFIGVELELPSHHRAKNKGILEHEHKIVGDCKVTARPTTHPYTLDSLSSIKFKIC